MTTNNLRREKSTIVATEWPLDKLPKKVVKAFIMLTVEI